jgi:DNA-binding NtrC family response regulator
MPRSSDPPTLLGRSAAVRRVRAFIERAAGVDAPVLLEGETGTGKGLVARLLHAGSARAEGPFVALNCAGIPDGLFESELFGHARGAFTGADRDREGLLAAADGGTLLLDEIGELPPLQQAKLLVAVEERSVRPVGATAERSVDLRLVSATCRTLPDELASGRFRADLYHRVALLRLTLPPLRERPEDIAPLARRFLVRAVARHGTGDRTLTDAARARLEEHAWPGNVRELAHAVEAAVILSTGARIDGALLARILDEGRVSRRPAGRSA